MEQVITVLPNTQYSLMFVLSNGETETPNFWEVSLDGGATLLDGQTDQQPFPPTTKCYTFTTDSSTTSIKLRFNARADTDWYYFSDIQLGTTYGCCAGEDPSGR